MPRELRSVLALLASLLLHALLGSAFAVGSARMPEVDPRQRSELADRWAGETFEVDAVVGQNPPNAVPTVAPAANPESSPARSVADQQTALALEREKRATKPAAREPVEREKSAREPPPTAERNRELNRKTRSGRRGESTTEQGAAAESSTTETAASEKAGAGDSSATYGAEGQPVQVRSLAKAFTRALPEAARRDKTWVELPLGAAGKVIVTITLDDEGRITDAEPEHTPPKHLERAIEKCILLLKGGQFALGRETVAGAGSEKLEIAATISMRAPSDDEFSDPGHTIDMGFETPKPDKPGKAYFTLASGRHVELEIALSQKR